MFAYCKNNPVSFKDSFGAEPIETIDTDGDGNTDCYIYEYSYEAVYFEFLWIPIWYETVTGKVYIFQGEPKNLPDTLRAGIDFVVIDNMQDVMHDPSLQVRNSYYVRDRNQMFSIIDVLLEYSSKYKTNWKRNRWSLYTEWVEHNRYALFSDSARHADFNNAEEGCGTIYFFLKALFRALSKVKEAVD